MELVDGVYALPITRSLPNRDVTIQPSAVETDDGLILIDVGFPDTVDLLADALGEHGFALDDVAHVLLTHQDGDHAGGLRDVLDATDATTFAHPEDTPVIEGERPPLKGGDGDRYSPAPIDVRIVDGVTFRTRAGPLRIVETPGHTPGHVSLYLPERDLLVAGDALTADEHGLAPPKEQFTPDMSTAIESVGRLADLGVTATHCYHGGSVEHGEGGVRDLYRSLRE